MWVLMTIHAVACRQHASYTPDHDNSTMIVFPAGMGVAPGDSTAKGTYALLVAIKAVNLLYVLAVLPYAAEWTNRTHTVAQVGELLASMLLLMQQYDVGGGAVGMTQVSVGGGAAGTTRYRSVGAVRGYTHAPGGVMWGVITRVNYRV